MNFHADYEDPDAWREQYRDDYADDRPAGGERFPLIPFGELKPRTAPAYTVKGILPRVGLAVVWGPPKCGKSFWFFDLLCHVALGWAYRDKRVQQGIVVYCAFEGAEGFRARAEAFRAKHGLNGQDVPLFLMPMRMDLIKDHRALIAAIRAQIGGATPGTVALDTLNRSFVGSESSDADMSAYVNAADAIREAFGCLVGIVHHCGIDSSRPRGHTSLTGAVDAQIAVKRDTADNIVATVEHMKDGAEGEVLVSRLEVVEVGTDDDGDAITSCVVVPGEASAAEKGKGSRLNHAEQVALKMLREALHAAGKPVTSNHVPPAVPVVTKSLWRDYCYQGGISAGDSSDEARKKAFQRAVRSLHSRGFVGIWEPHVWVAHDPQA